MAGDEGDRGAVHDVLAQQPQAAVVGCHGELVASVARAIPSSCQSVDSTDRESLRAKEGTP
jgi:hypothetical protein